METSFAVEGVWLIVQYISRNAGYHLIRKQWRLIIIISLYFNEADSWKKWELYR